MCTPELYLNSPNLSYRKYMSCVERIETSPNCDPNNRLPANSPYCTQPKTALNLKGEYCRWSLRVRWSISHIYFTDPKTKHILYITVYSRLKTLCYTNKQNLTELSLTIHLPQWFLLRSHALRMCDPNKLSQTLGSHRVCWGHTCAKHVTSTQIIEEADWMVSKISETSCLFLWVFIKLYCLFFCSRRVFGVVEERCVCIVLDLDATTDSQFDIYRHALIQALKEQIMFLAKFNLIRFVASLAI